MKKKKTKKTKLKEILLPKTPLEKTLGAIFLFLLAIVIVLSLAAIKLSNEAKKNSVDATVPIIEETKTTLNVDISALKEGTLKEYKFKVTNYKNKTINKAKTAYSVNIIPNNNNIECTLYKDSDNINLLANSLDHQDFLNSKKKEETTYYLIIKVKEDTSKNATIKVDIIS